MCNSIQYKLHLIKIVFDDFLAYDNQACSHMYNFFTMVTA